MPYLTLFNAVSSDPLRLWACRGAIKFSSRGLELHDDALIVSPSFAESLGIQQPCFNFVFAWPTTEGGVVAFEFHVDDAAGHTRRIRLSNRYERVVCVPEMLLLPLRRVESADARALVCVRVDLARIVARHYPHTQYKSTQRVIAQGSFTVRLGFFSSARVASELWPAEFRAAQLPE